MVRGQRLRATLTTPILETSSHRADTYLKVPLVKAVDAQLAIISVAAGNRFAHPAEVTLGKLQDVRTYRTDQQGNVEVVSDG